MPLSSDFEEKYYALLEMCLYAIEKSNKFDAACAEYKKLRADIIRRVNSTVYRQNFAKFYGAWDKFIKKV